MLKPKKELGQNFLVDQGVVADLIKAADIKEDDVVLEVGAGGGIITRPLAEKARRVIAVEIDKDLIPQLISTLSDFPGVEIVRDDILKLEIGNLQLETFKTIGSIPYQITSPLIHKLLKLKKRPKSITIIVQKEVAEKIVAKPPKASYLSNFVANFGRAEIIRTIKPNAFRPPPKVDSAILHIPLYPTPFVALAKGAKPYSECKRGRMLLSEAKGSCTPDPKFESFLHHGFASPRKMLNKRFPAETLKKLGIDPQRRPQTLSFEEWVKLFAAKDKAR